MAVDRKKLIKYLEDGHTNIEAGKKFGVSKGYVSQLKRKIKDESKESNEASPVVKVKKRGRDRSKRVPLGVPRMKLTAHNIPKDKVGRWINDKPGRLADAVRGSYDFINKDGIIVGTGYEDENEDMGSRVSRVVGKEDDGTPIKAYLMVIDKDLYEEDQKEKMKQVDMVDKAIKGGKFLEKSGDKRYIPSEGINIEEKVGSPIT